MADVQSSTLYAGSVSESAIYQVTKGEGFQWGDYVQTEVVVDGKPRQLTRAIHAANPLVANIENPVVADFATTPAITFDGRELVASELAYKNTYKPRQWKDTFPTFQPSGTSIDLQMNPKITSVIFDLAMNAIKQQMNELHAIGDLALSPDPMEWYDGFTTLILADSDPTQVGTPAVLTSANILAKVKELIQAVPARLRSKSNLFTFCSVADYDLYMEARATTQTYSPQTDVESNNKLIQSYGSKIKLIPIDGMPKDFIFTTLAGRDDSSNLVQGVWLEKDSDILKVFRFTEVDQSWRILMRMSMGVQYKSGLDIFYINNV